MNVDERLFRHSVKEKKASGNSNAQCQANLREVYDVMKVSHF